MAWERNEKKELKTEAKFMTKQLIAEPYFSEKLRKKALCARCHAIYDCQSLVESQGAANFENCSCMF